jgi:enoyl-CoA hydratase
MEEKGALNMHAYETLAVTITEGVARVDLNRPDKGNCLNAVMWQELGRAFNELSSTAHVRTIVLGGAGKHFSTGIDLEYLMVIGKELDRLSEGRKQEALRHIIAELQASVSAIEECPKPVLAAIAGFCLGAGVDIAAACDMRYATASTRFSVKEGLSYIANRNAAMLLSDDLYESVAAHMEKRQPQYED